MDFSPANAYMPAIRRTARTQESPPRITAQNRRRPDMELILLIVHLILAVALIGVVLLQRSEGGALGIGGGGGGGGMSGFLTGAATANLLTRATAVIAALFIASSMGLAIMSGNKRAPTSVVTGTGGATPTTQQDAGSAPAVPPAEPAKPQN